MAAATDSTPAPSRALLSLAAGAALSGMGAAAGRAVDAATAAVLARVARPGPPRDARGRFARRAELPPEPLLQAETPEPATLDDVRRCGDRTSIVPKGNNAPATAEDLGLTREDVRAVWTRVRGVGQGARTDLVDNINEVASERPTGTSKGQGLRSLQKAAAEGNADAAAAIRRDLDALVDRAKTEPCTLYTVPETDTAAQARTLHLRRELCRALDHGFAMLDAIGLGSAALDQMDRAIRFMDETDGDPEAEPSLGWTSTAAGVVFLGDASDREDDSEENEGTALERHGRGFVRAGDDDAEEDDAAEQSDEPEGDGGEPYLSVVEWDGQGDNWGRTGHATSGWGTDVENVNEDGDEGRGAEANDPWWFARQDAASGKRTEAAHV